MWSPLTTTTPSKLDPKLQQSTSQAYAAALASSW
jgi:hypothetical protein